VKKEREREKTNIQTRIHKKTENAKGERYAQTSD